MSSSVSNNHSLSPYIAGFTLIELVISITVLAILLVLTLPAFQTMVMNNRVSSETDSLANALNYARNVAVSQNINVTVCPFGAASSTTCGNSWQNGWIVVSKPTAGVNVLLQANTTSVNAPVLSTVPINGVASSSVTFDARGIATTQANFKLCDSRGGTFARSVEVLPTGFIQSSAAMGIEVWDGGALACP